MKFEKRYGWGLVFALLTMIGVVLTRAQSSPVLMLFVSPASLTVYFPSGVSVTPQELGFEVIRGTTTIDQINLLDFSTFRSRSSEFQTPICFHIERSGIERPPLPAECQLEGVMVISELVNEANAFWFDAGGTNQTRTIILLRGVNSLTTCVEGDTPCQVTVVPPIYTPFPTRTSAPSATLDETGRNQDPLEMRTAQQGVQTAARDNFSTYSAEAAQLLTQTAVATQTLTRTVTRTPTRTPMRTQKS